MHLPQILRRAAASACLVLAYPQSAVMANPVPGSGQGQAAPAGGAAPETAHPYSRKALGKPVLPCSEVRARVNQFLDLHYVFKNFDNELSKRSYRKLFEGFDPSKSYFMKGDLETFKAEEDKLDDAIARADCSKINAIHELFLKRVKERAGLVQELLSKPFGFNVAEEMPIGKLDWSKDEAELNERWRKRIKFQVMNMKEMDGEAKARERLKRRYEQVRKNFEEQSQDEVMSVFVNAFAQALDPHSGHFLPEDQEEFNIRLGNQLEGIGATLQEVDGYITVKAIVPGGAAQRDGRLALEDKIVAVDPGDGSGLTDLIDVDVNRAVRLIRGKKGTTVKLVLLRKSEQGNTRLTISIVRDQVKLTASEAKGDVLHIEGKKIGVIKVPNFYTDFSCRARPGLPCKGVAYDVLREIKALQKSKPDGMILDLRWNGGGDLRESIRLTGLFIPEGTVVQTVDRRRLTKTEQDQDPSVQYGGPLLVLVNKYSASASEIVAGAIQDYGRGIIAGDEHTYGKATVQVVQEVPGTDGRMSNGAIKVTQQKFYRPSGKSNQEMGVQSDVVIPSVLSVTDAGERENDFVLPGDVIKQAPDFQPLMDLAKFVPALKKQSGERVAKSPEFKELSEKIEKLKKEQEKSSVSLLEEPQKDSKDGKGKKPGDKKAGDKKAEKKDEDEDDPENGLGEMIVIRKNDIQLREAARVLIDGMALAYSPARPRPAGNP